MKMEAEIVMIRPTSTFTKPNEYWLTIKGKGTKTECDRVLAELFRTPQKNRKTNK